MSRSKRIVCYAINGAGLGHVTRLLGVARWMRRIGSFLDEKPPEVLFLTSSDASDVLAQENFAAFKIPSKTIAKNAYLDNLEYRRLAKYFVWQTLGVFSPDLLVVDTCPAGSFDELFQVLDGPFKKGFIYRHVKPEYAQRAVFQAALKMYDSVAIPHASDSQSARQCLSQLPTEEGVRCVGEVIQFDRSQLLDRESARQELSIAPARKLIYLSAGGGGDPNSEASLHMWISTLLQDSTHHLLVGAGPLYRGTRRMGERITWCESPAVWRYFGGCDAAVSAGGYNSFHELLYAGVPTLFFAQDKIADDQWNRIQLARSLNACRSIRYFRDPEDAMRQLRELLSDDTSSAIREAARSMIPENGAARCAAELMRPLYPSGKVDWALQVLAPEIVQSVETLCDGSQTMLADWLAPIFPQNRIEMARDFFGTESLLQQLSAPAAGEVRRVLEKSDTSQSQHQLVRSLNLLFESIRAEAKSVPWTTQETKAVAEEAFRTISALAKRYEYLHHATGGSWRDWMNSILAGVQRLVCWRSGMPVVEGLRLFRSFPRIDDVDTIDEVFAIFERYIEHCMAKTERTHEIMRHVQLLKMMHASVTRPILDRSLGIAS